MRKKNIKFNANWSVSRWGLYLDFNWCLNQGSCNALAKLRLYCFFYLWMSFQTNFKTSITLQYRGFKLKLTVGCCCLTAPRIIYFQNERFNYSIWSCAGRKTLRSRPRIDYARFRWNGPESWVCGVSIQTNQIGLLSLQISLLLLW